MPYEWRPAPEFRRGTERLVVSLSGYTVGFVFPPHGARSQWAWSGGHVPSGQCNEAYEDTKEDAKKAMERWFKDQDAKWRPGC